METDIGGQGTAGSWQLAAGSTGFLAGAGFPRGSREGEASSAASGREVGLGGRRRAFPAVGSAVSEPARGVVSTVADPGIHRQPRGAHLENIVALDLLAWGHSRTDRTTVMYWRTTTRREVDFVIETGQQLIPIEVKSNVI